MNKSLYRLDWISIILYLALVSFGLVNIYSTNFNENSSIFNFKIPVGKQFLFFMVSLFVGGVILIAKSKFFAQHDMRNDMQHAMQHEMRHYMHHDIQRALATRHATRSRHATSASVSVASTEALPNPDRILWRARKRPKKKTSRSSFWRTARLFRQWRKKSRSRLGMSSKPMWRRTWPA